MDLQSDIRKLLSLNRFNFRPHMYLDNMISILFAKMANFLCYTVAIKSVQWLMIENTIARGVLNHSQKVQNKNWHILPSRASRGAWVGREHGRWVIMVKRTDSNRSNIPQTVLVANLDAYDFRIWKNFNWIFRTFLELFRLFALDSIHCCAL